MRLAFCDSAGLSSLAQEPVAVHSVVIVEGDHQWHEIDADIKAIIQTLPLPDGERERFEFHAVELFQGDKNLRLTPPERRRVQRAFLELIPKYSLPFVVGSVDKERAEQTVAPYSFEKLGVTYEDVAFLFSVERLEWWFRKECKDEKALLISDTSDVGELLEHAVRTYRESPMPQYRLADFRLDHVVALPLFTDSKKSWGVQLADHVSYFFKRVRMGKENSRELYSIIDPFLYDYREYPLLPSPEDLGEGETLSILK
jgi:hypothetical protein